MRRQWREIHLLTGGLLLGTACTLMSSELRPQTSKVVGSRSSARTPSVEIRTAQLLKFPHDTDCNSPVHWDGEAFYLFNSFPNPWRSSGPDLFHLGAALETHYDKETSGGRWIESTWKDDDGTLYGWYHNEPHPVCPSKPDLTAPRIGAARSRDNGAHWEDLGLVLAAPPYPLRCDTEDKFFAGGNGDFSVIADTSREYLYFFFSSYYPHDASEQGVGVARLRYSDRNDPVGRVWKWYKGRWNEPGFGGHVTPIFPVRTPWHTKNVDAFWGPSIHWNTHLASFVLLLNRAIDRNWLQDGIYVSFGLDLANPGGWTEPSKILDRAEITDNPAKLQGWYPQVIGIDGSKHETDKLAGQVARLFVHGQSRWEIVFLRAGERAK
jgi:hypothetical protein